MLNDDRLRRLRERTSALRDLKGFDQQSNAVRLRKTLPAAASEPATYLSYRYWVHAR